MGLLVVDILALEHLGRAAGFGVFECPLSVRSRFRFINMIEGGRPNKISNGMRDVLGLG